MPTLLSINSYHYRRGGSDVVYLDHAELFREMGWATAFMSMHHPQNLPTEWSRYFIDELEFGAAYSVRQKMVMAAKAVYSWEAQRKLKALLDEHRVDIAHLHCIYHHLSPSILPVLKRAGVPTVMTAHDLKIACPAYKMLNQTGVCERCKDGSVLNVIKHRCVRDSLAASAIVAVESGLQRTMRTYERYLDKIVVPSQFFIRKFVEWGWRPEQFAYIPNYVDASRFTLSEAPGKYFLYFGRLAPEKGVATLIDAAKRANVSLKIVGTGPLDGELKAKAAGSSEIEFLGFKTGAVLFDLVRGARAVVLPSEWYENAPMSILESFAMGTPVIGADMGGIPEMLSAETGWVFESGNAEALKELLQQVQSADDAEIASKGRAARSLVEQKFSKAAYVEAMRRLYAELGVVNESDGTPNLEGSRDSWSASGTRRL